MDDLTPSFEQPDWLPRLEAVEWNRLKGLTGKHQLYLHRYRRAPARVAELTDRYALEDRQALDAAKATARGGPEVAVDVTPQIRRDAELEVARERADSIRGEFRQAIVSIVEELLDHQAERDEAIAAALESVGYGADRMDHGSSALDGEPQDLEAANEAAARESVRLLADDQRFAVRRRAIKRDQQALERLFLSQFGIGGERILPEIAKRLGDERGRMPVSHASLERMAVSAS